MSVIFTSPGGHTNLANESLFLLTCITPEEIRCRCCQLSFLAFPLLRSHEHQPPKLCLRADAISAQANKVQVRRSSSKSARGRSSNCFSAVQQWAWPSGFCEERHSLHRSSPYLHPRDSSDPISWVRVVSCESDCIHLITTRRCSSVTFHHGWSHLPHWAARCYGVTTGIICQGGGKPLKGRHWLYPPCPCF